MLVLCPQGSISNVRQLTRQANAVNVINGKTSACWHRRCGSSMVDHDAVLASATANACRQSHLHNHVIASSDRAPRNIVVDWMMIGWLVSRWCPCIRQNKSSSVWIYFLVMKQMVLWVECFSLFRLQYHKWPLGRNTSWAKPQSRVQDTST